MRIVVALLTVALAAPLALALADPTDARNAAFFRALLPAADDATIGSLVDRANGVDLTAIDDTRPPADATRSHWGDVWVIEVGEGPCNEIQTPVYQPVYSPISSWPLYRGWLSRMTTNAGDYTLIIGWMFGTSELAYESAGFTALGVNDLYCVEADGRHLAFPFLTGVAYLNEEDG